MKELVSVNGQIVAPESAVVSVFDSGFLQGIGLFETMRAYNGRVFQLDAHVDRLAASARALGWAAALDADAIREDVLALVSRAGAGDARVRLTVTTGSLRQIELDEPALTVVVTATGDAKYPDECYVKGVTVTLSRYRQNPGDPTVGHKTTSYFSRLAALREAHACGAFEALWLTPGERLAEGSISTLFVVRDEQLITPPLDTPVLPGITRARIIESAVRLAIPTREAPLTVQDLRDADEAFLAGSLMELVPVVRLDRDPLGAEKPGDVTRMLYEAYGELIEGECGDG